MRQLCNVAYAAIVEWKDEKEREAFDADLLADDDGVGYSRGTRELMAIMGVRVPTSGAEQ